MPRRSGALHRYLAGTAPGRRARRLSARADGDEEISAERSDRFLEFLGGAERDLLAGLDLDLLAGRRVAAHAGGALAHLQNAQTADADAVALLEVLGDVRHQIAEHGLGLFLGEFVIFRKLRCEIPQRHCSLLTRRCCLGHRLTSSFAWCEK